MTVFNEELNKARNGYFSISINTNKHGLGALFNTLECLNSVTFNQIMVLIEKSLHFLHFFKSKVK